MLGVHFLDQHGELAGVIRSLAKQLLVPFTPEELVATVDRAIEELS